MGALAAPQFRTIQVCLKDRLTLSPAGLDVRCTACLRRLHAAIMIWHRGREKQGIKAQNIFCTAPAGRRPLTARRLAPLNQRSQPMRCRRPMRGLSCQRLTAMTAPENRTGPDGCPVVEPPQGSRLTASAPFDQGFGDFVRKD